MSDNIDPTKRIFVTGHRGMVGSAVVRQLAESGFSNILTATRQELDLRDPVAVDKWFAENKPDYVIHAAGRVGGIQANTTQPADFLHDNILIHATVLRAACTEKTKKLLYLGSSCVYPRDSPQPIREEYLLTGPLEKTNEAYAIAKISGIKATQAYRRQYGCDFISAMPTNLYGPNDNYDLQQSHVIPALIQKFHQAKTTRAQEVVLWGSGRPYREFLHVNDLARACLFLLRHYSDELPVNVGCGEDLSIAALADIVREIVYPQAEIKFDPSMPDGTPRKLLDITRIRALGWKPEIDLREGIADVYNSYLNRLT